MNATAFAGLVHRILRFGVGNKNYFWWLVVKKFNKPRNSFVACRELDYNYLL